MRELERIFGTLVAKERSWKTKPEFGLKDEEVTCHLKEADQRSQQSADFVVQFPTTTSAFFTETTGTGSSAGFSSSLRRFLSRMKQARLKPVACHGVPVHRSVRERDLPALGVLQIRRGSHGEPDEMGRC